MSARAAAAAACLLLALGAGCGERAEPIGVSVPAHTLTVQGAGDAPTVLGARPQRIVAVGGTPARILRGLGAGRLLLGSGLDIITGEELATQVRRLRPDLIVGSSESDAADLDRSARAAKAPLYIVPDNSYRDVERAIDDLGLLTGRAVRARELVAGMQGAQARVAKRLANAKPVSVFVDTGYFGTFGYRSLPGDIVRLAGGDNVAGASPEAGPFDLRRLARLQPAVYLATSDSGTTLRKLRRPGAQTRRLAAVRAGHFRTVPARLLQAGPQAGAGLVYVAKLLHPDAFR